MEGRLDDIEQRFESNGPGFDLNRDDKVGLNELAWFSVETCPLIGSSWPRADGTPTL